MFLHDRVGDREAQSRSFAHFFDGEKGIEDLRLHLVGNPRAIVVDLEHDRFLIRVVPRPQHEDAAAVRLQHRLLRVDDQVEQDLLHLMSVGEDLRQAGGERVDHRHVADPLLVRAQGERFADHLIDVHHRPGRLALPRERQQVADDARGAFRFAEDRVEPAADRRFEGRPLREPLGPTQDRGQRVVELVRDAGDRLAERGHLLGLQELVIDVARFVVQFLALADVADQRFDADGAVFGRRVGARRDLDPDGAVVGASQAQQVVAHRSVGGEALEQGDPRLRIDETLAIERADVHLGRFAGVSKNQFEVRIGGHRRGGLGAERPDVYALVYRFEQPRERRGASFHG